MNKFIGEVKVNFKYHMQIYLCNLFFFLNGKYNIYKNLISVQDEQRSKKETTNKDAIYMRNTNDNTKIDNA
jgi:hypothetical protein